MSGRQPEGRLAFLVRNLEPAGVQRSQMRLAATIAARGHPVDLVACATSPVRDGIAPAGVRLVQLRPTPKLLARMLPFAADPLGTPLLAPALLAKKRPSPTMPCLPALVGYLRQVKPAALVAGPTDLNLEALWASRLAPSRIRVIVTERVHLSTALASSSAWRRRHHPVLMARYYPRADAIIAVSNGVADDLAVRVGLDRRSISVVYNPVVGPDLARSAEAPLDHPWFASGQPPVVLAAGRLTEQKDFTTLLRAFAILRRRRAARLLVLGGTRDPERTTSRIAELLDLARSLGVADDVALPGPEPNPFRFMARAAVFVLSSAWEGFGNVLVEAMACGCPVVSTDCPSGPAEILDHGRFGPLVGVGHAAGMASAIERMLDMPTPAHELLARAAEFSLDRAAEAYLRHLLPTPEPPSCRSRHPFA